MVDAMGSEPGDALELWRDGSVLLGVSRRPWEMAAGFADGVLLLQEGDLVVAADASLYYRDDLRKALLSAGSDPRGDSPSHLIAAAYRVWGDACVDRLEGDFSFLLWDRERRVLLASRDFTGTRPLFYAEAGSSLLVASRIAGLLAHPDCPRDLNLTAVGEAAAGLFALRHETAYRSVSQLPAGWNLAWRAGERRLHQYWDPQPVELATSSFDDAAEELRELLCRSVSERMDSAAPTSVWLSGGYDSTAIYGAGMEVLRQRGGTEKLEAISVSYPPGDSGREDELIAAVSERWDGSVHWLDIRDIPFFSDPAANASQRDEPFAHAYEEWNRALATATRESGCRVALGGYGGDELFGGSAVYLADLFRTGRWLALSSEWSALGLGGSGFKRFFQLAVQPFLPPAVLRAAGALRPGKPPLRTPWDRPLPPWMNRRFVRERGLLEIARRERQPRRGRSLEAYHLDWLLTHPFHPRAYSYVFGVARDAGVEIRSPLYDRRIIRFARGRPREDRIGGFKVKRVLRRAVRGLVPGEVLAPRGGRTGTTASYFDSAMRVQHAGFLRETLWDPMLAEVGIIDREVLRREVDAYLQKGMAGLALPIYLTLQTELWLRTHAGLRAISDEEGSRMASIEGATVVA
ncbi:asparagine synthase-related protein [soil metagenome]